MPTGDTGSPHPSGRWVSAKRLAKPDGTKAMPLTGTSARPVSAKRLAKPDGTKVTPVTGTTGHQTPTGATFVGVRCYLEAESPGHTSNRRLIIEQKFVAVPRTQAKGIEDKIRQMAAGAQHGLDDSIAEAVAGAVGNKVFGPVKRFQWEIGGTPNPTAASVVLDRFQQSVRSLVQQPLESAGVATQAAVPLSDLGATMLTEPVMDLGQKCSLILDVAGIAFGAATGNHPLVAVCIKDLVHNQTRAMIAAQARDALDSLFGGWSGRSSPSPSVSTLDLDDHVRRSDPRRSRDGR